MKNISNAIRIIGIFFKFFIIFSLSAFIILKHGIKVDKFTLANVNLEQLYIKLDKKIILKASNITLPNLKKDKSDITSSNYFLNLSKNAFLIGLIFEEISLKNIKIGDIKSEILYKNDSFFIDNELFLVDLTIKEKLDKHTELINIKGMQFKDFNISLSGSVSANLKAKKYAFTGFINSYELGANIDFALIKNELRYKIYNLNANSLKDFMLALDNKFKIHKEVKNWIYGYIIASSYTINEINGRINLKDKNFYLNDLNATANAKNLYITLNKAVKPIYVKQANITLSNSKLNFELENPTYQEIPLDGSSLYIHDIFSKKDAGLYLSLKTKSIFNKDIKDILKIYKINLPIEQTSGKTDADVKIEFSFSRLKALVNAKFIIQNSEFMIGKAKFKSKEAEVILKNNFNIFIKAKEFGMDFFKSDLTADIDIKNNKAQINGVLKDLNLKADSGDSIVVIKDEPINALLEFKDKFVRLDFDDLGVELIFSDKNLINIKKPFKFIQNSEILNKVGVKNIKEINLNTNEFKNFDIFAKDVELNLPLLTKDTKPYEKQSFKIDITDKILNLKSDDELISVKIDNKGINIDIKDIDIAIKDSNNTNFNTKLNIKGKNSNLIFIDQNKSLKLPTYDITADREILNFVSNLDSGYIRIIKNGNNFSAEARDISGEYINQFLNKDSFLGGKFKLKVVGKKDNYKGEVRFYDTYFKDYVFYQRLLSFLDSIPALISLKTPDFNSKGFAAKHGKILFKTHNDTIEFIAIDISGSSADILGSGTINLKTKEINIDLKIDILKDASGIIGKIPLANQIILGKDRTISTIIKIRGTLDEPKYSTQILKDTLLVPFKLIRNILQAPFLIFD